MLDSGPQNRFFGDSAMNLASFTTAGPLSIQLKELVAFICQYGPKNYVNSAKNEYMLVQCPGGP